MFIAFAAGARIVIVPDSIKVMPSKLCRILFDEEKVTILQVSLVFIWKNYQPSIFFRNYVSYVIKVLFSCNLL